MKIPESSSRFPRLAMTNFRTRKCLAHSATGRVFDVLWGDKAAVVKFPANPEEFWIHCQLADDPGVLDVWATVTDPMLGEGLLMPCAQTDLQSELDRGARVVLLHLAPAARALAHMHAMGWLHRDVHPGNFVLHEGTWKLIDFGLSRPYAGGFRCPQQSHAVIRFASVEQLSNGIERPCDDWYSFGLVALSALHGKKPWDRLQEPQILLQKLKAPFSPFGDCISQNWLRQLASDPPPDENAIIAILEKMQLCSCIQ